MIKDFVDLANFSGPQLTGLLARALADKKLFAAGRLEPTLSHRTLAMIFEKPSLRTRVSFETAMTHLGGHAIYLTPADIGLGTREPVKDIARVLGCMCDGIMARTFAHETIRQLARFSPVGVINALSDYSHPCQAMADMMTVAGHFGGGDDPLSCLAGKVVTFVGDGNNVARSLAVACSRLDMRFVLAAPPGYELEREFTDTLPAGSYRVTGDVRQAVAGADVIYADTWVSMGQEDEKARRVRDFSGFQIDSALMAAAPGHAVVLHCLPAYRGYEITDEVFEAHAETIFEQSANRLHFQRTLLNVLIGAGGID